MNKQAVLQHNGMTQDVSRSKHNNNYYFEGKNIRITSTNDSTTGVITNEKGNEFLLEIPTPSFDFVNKIISYNNKTLNYTTNEINDLYSSVVDFGNQIIISNCNTKDGFIILSTNDNGLDCIWYLKYDNFDLTLLYVRDLDFSTSNPIQILNNYENSKIDKIYWIDGKEQMRFLNIHHNTLNMDLENLIDLSSTSLNVTSEVNLINPIIEEVNYGGSHTSGMIQYSYSYYKLNGSQSALSPLSNIIPLGKSSIEGGSVNEVVGTIPKIKINTIDNNFTNIRLYAVKYTSYNELPSISLIADRDITGFNSFTYYDDGRIIQDITLEEFIFLNGKIIIPKHIESKDNRLFMFNYKERIYNLNFENNNIDFRAYSFPELSEITSVFNSLSDYNEGTSSPVGEETIINSNYINAITFLDEKSDTINGNYDLNKYQFNSTTIGGEGPFLKYEIIRTTENRNNVYDYRFLKDNELYRIGIQLYNKYGIKSLPKWIADFVTSSNNLNINNLNGFYAGIKLSFKPEFYVWLNTNSNFLNNDGVYDEFLKPVGFKLLRADRTLTDKTITGQGLVNGMLSQSLITGYPNLTEEIKKANEGLKIPSFMRRFDDYLCPMYGNETYKRVDSFSPENHPQKKSSVGISAGGEFYKSRSSKSFRNSVYQFNQLMQLYSPEIIFEMINNIESTKLKVLGTIDNDYNAVKGRWEEWAFGGFGGFTTHENVISAFDVKCINNPGDEQIAATGLIGPQWYTDTYDHRKRTTTTQNYRSYNGTFRINTDNTIYNIYGTPEISEEGQSSKKYNNDDDLIYTNSLTPLITDVAGDDNNSNTFHSSITNVLSNGSRCATFALGDDSVLTKNRLTIENLFENSSLFGTIPGQIGGIQNTFNLSKIVSFETELSSLVFTDQYVGVLETGNIYFNNDTLNIITTYDFLNVSYIFDTISEYDSFATDPGTDDLTGLRIAIVDNVDNTIYEIVDQTLSLSGLIDTTEVFNFLEPSVSTIQQYVFNATEMYAINTEELTVGYVVGITSTGIIYEWTGTDWIENGSFTVDSDYTGGVGLICEFVNKDSLKYIGNYYGGNSYESKTKTIYVEASKYFLFNNLNMLTDTSFNIVDPGDTFVQLYQIMKIGKNNVEPDNGSIRRTELISVRLESTINQNKRNDESITSWEDTFSPSQGDYHSYNKVYSQSSNLIKSQDISYELKINEEFDTGILSTQIKRPGETIDNWTNISINDNIFLEGKYGAINAVIKYNDSIITFQDNAVANIAINPRVQVNASDGIGIELGTGAVLYDFKYLSTNSGTLNKWGVIGGNNGVYYYDTLNNGVYLLSGNVNKLSDIKGIHSFLNNNIFPNIIKKNNHILKEGIQIGYDYLNNTIYFTFHQKENSQTLSFNEFKQEFISLHDFIPSFYFIRSNLFITANELNNKLYNHIESLYNIYYDNYFPSYITYNINPEPYNDCVFDNINFKSEVYIDNLDQPNDTITSIQAYNDYQNSSLVPLILGRNGNLRRRFRDWNAEIPREGRNRIRNPWIKLKLQFDNVDNKKLILHDLIVSYTI